MDAEPIGEGEVVESVPPDNFSGHVVKVGRPGAPEELLVDTGYDKRWVHPASVRRITPAPWGDPTVEEDVPPADRVGGEQEGGTS